MPRKRRSRIYWRERGGVRRAYGDFRDLGGGRQALVPPGDSRATTDPDVATKLVSEIVDRLELERRRGTRGKVLLGLKGRTATLGSFAEEHLSKKAALDNVTDRWMIQAERHLREAVSFFGADRELLTIEVSDLEGYLMHLKGLSNGRGGKVSLGTQRKYLNSLSNLFGRARRLGKVPPEFNPVASLEKKPTAKPKEAHWLEVEDAARFLESARTYLAPVQDGAFPYMYPLIATFLLTGGRQAEVFGLEVDDISFKRRTVTIRPNDWRRLKSSNASRSLPLWPQLSEILRVYLAERERSDPLGALLFPSARHRDQPESIVRDVRKALDRIGARAGFAPGEVRTKAFRHTYCAARLQTLDNGAPVSPWTVSREMGHGGRALVDRIYGHLGQVRHRSEVVEFLPHDAQRERAPTTAAHS